MLGSCNGLVALYNSPEDIGLWNPSTRKSLKVPVSEIEFRSPNGRLIVIYGFGYDPISDDYKLVRIAEFLGDDKNIVEPEVKVYSLKENSWKRVKGFPYHLGRTRRYGVLVSDALHWVVLRRSESESDTKRLIAAFDLKTEETYEVPLLDLWAQSSMIVAVLGGCLCMIAKNQNSPADIWVMKEYGVKNSWTKLLSVVDPELVHLKPLVYSSCKDRVLVNQNGNKFVWYDPTAKGAEDVKIEGVPEMFVTPMFIPEIFDVNMCVGSLVKLDGNYSGSNRKKQQANQGKQKNNKKKRDDFLSVGFKLKL